MTKNAGPGKKQKTKKQILDVFARSRRNEDVDDTKKIANGGLKSKFRLTARKLCPIYEIMLTKRDFRICEFSGQYRDWAENLTAPRKKNRAQEIKQLQVSSHGIVRTPIQRSDEILNGGLTSQTN